MPRVKNLPRPSDSYYDSVKDILCSSVEVEKAKYGAVSLISDEIGGLQSYVSHGSLSDQGAGISAACWVATHRRCLALENQEQALGVPDLVINESESLPLICVPIEVNGTLLGTIYLSFLSVAGQEELLSKQVFLKVVANLMGYVIENANLRRRLEEARKLATSLNKTSLEIEEAERERITLEVHDSVAQTLASAFQYLQTIENIGSFREESLRQLFTKTASLIKQAIRETREIISSITPPALDTLGLVLTLQQELKQFERETECQVDFQSATWPSLPKHIEFAIYRIIREAITNVRKHAESPKLKVQLSQEQERLVIMVKDWGKGFIPAEQKQSSLNRSIGLLSMRRRVELLGGTVEISSSLGKGTEVLINIPWSIGGK